MERESWRKSHCRKLFLALAIIFIIGIAICSLLDISCISKAIIGAALACGVYPLGKIWEIYRIICDRKQEHTAMAFRDEMVEDIELCKKQITVGSVMVICIVVLLEVVFMEAPYNLL